VLFPYRAQAAGPSDWKYHYEKILAERVALQSSLPSTVLRLPAVYGPGDPQHRLRPYIKRMLDQAPGILLESSLSSWRWSHGYVEDLAQAVACAVTDGRAAGKVYNLGEAVVPTTAERIRNLAKLSGWNGRAVTLERDRVPPHLLFPFEPKEDLVMDTRRIRAELGFRERLPVEEGLRRTIAWERSIADVLGDPGPAEYQAEEAALSGNQGVT
jgi:nucleoside-diphosphate-sugar epimerase